MKKQLLTLIISLSFILCYSQTEIVNEVLSDPMALGDVDILPSFPSDQFSQFIASSFVYPEELLKTNNNISGIVFISFIVEKDGSLSNIELMRGLHPLLNIECIRVVQSSPKWIPGRHNGLPVRVKFVQPIRF